MTIDEERADPIAIDARRPDISVVVPVFNEEGNIANLYGRLKTTLEPLDCTFELLFVDDGSRDASYERLAALYRDDERVRVIRFVRNFGQQMAVAAGFQHARGRAIVLIDADLQTAPEDIPLLLAKLAEGYDIVYGVRERRKDPLVRRAGSWCMSHLLYRVTGIDIPDSASGFIALDRRFVENINLFNERSKYLSGLFAWLSYGRWAAVPVKHESRKRGQSNYNFAKLVALGLNFVCSFSSLPLQFATFAGAFLGTLGILGMLASVFAVMIWGLDTISALCLLAAAMTLMAAVQLASIGILGEYVGRIFTEVRERPPYVIAETLERTGLK